MKRYYNNTKNFVLIDDNHESNENSQNEDDKIFDNEDSIYQYKTKLQKQKMINQFQI